MDPGHMDIKFFVLLATQDLGSMERTVLEMFVEIQNEIDRQKSKGEWFSDGETSLNCVSAESLPIGLENTVDLEIIFKVSHSVKDNTASQAISLAISSSGNKTTEITLPNQDAVISVIDRVIRWLVLPNLISADLNDLFEVLKPSCEPILAMFPATETNEAFSRYSKTLATAKGIFVFIETGFTSNRGGFLFDLASKVGEDLDKFANDNCMIFFVDFFSVKLAPTTGLINLIICAEE